MTQPQVTDLSTKKPTQLPIDIDYSKFLSWLIDRRRIPRNWNTQLRAARTLARTAHAQTSPSVRERLSLPIQLDPHESIDYLVVRLAFNGILSEDPGVAEKDLLGRYKDPILRSWYAASSAFEKGNIFLADAAQLLVRNTDIEAPAIRQRIARLTADGSDAARREGAVVRAASDARMRYVAACQRYDINPDLDKPDFHALLTHFVSHKVPTVLRAAFHAAVNAKAALLYYEDFAAQIAHCDNISPPCPILRAIIASDVNAAVRTPHFASNAENQTLSTPDFNDKSANLNTCREDNVNGDGIDWNIDVASSGTDAFDGASNEMQSNITMSDAQSDSALNEEVNDENGGRRGGINWSIEVEDGGRANMEGTSGALDNSNLESKDVINWDIEIGDTGNVGDPHEPVHEIGNSNKDDGGIDWGIELGETGTNFTIVNSEVLDDTGEESLTLMEMETRAAFLNDVGELSAFLTRRVLEVERSNSGVGVWTEVMSAMPDSIRRVSEDDARIMLQSVQDVRDSLTSSDASHILALQSNPRVFDRTARELMQLLASAIRAHDAIGALHEKRARIASDLATEIPKIEVLSKKTRAVVNDIEAALTKLYNGRTVNILGEINNVFPPDNY